MAGEINITALEQLGKYMDQDGVLEVVIRNQKKRFKNFYKLVIKNVKKPEEQELVKKTTNLLQQNQVLVKKMTNLFQQNQTLVNKTTDLLQQNRMFFQKDIQMLTNVVKLQELSLVFSGLDLCATCVGFAIMYKKLDKISNQISQLMNVIKQGNSVQADYEFKKVISEHSNMLDSRKTQKYYTEEQMRKLVDDEYNVLNMLLDVYAKDLADDQNGLVFSIFTLASMLAVSLRYFDELYYFNNKEVIGDGDIWHSSHDNWMSVFDKLLDEQMVKRIQDYGFLDLKLSTVDNDIYSTGMKEQIEELVESIKDNQKLIVAFGDADLMADYEKFMMEDVASSIDEAFAQTEGALDDEDIVKAVNSAKRQVGLAV